MARSPFGVSCRVEIIFVHKPAETRAGGNRLRRSISALNAPLVRNRTAFNSIGLLEGFSIEGCRRDCGSIRSLSATRNGTKGVLGRLVWHPSSLSPARLRYGRDACAYRIR